MNNSENIFSVIENGDKLEFHYSFGNDDDSHALNAYIRNACEKEFLEIIKRACQEKCVNGYMSCQQIGTRLSNSMAN